jgi:hypothetical protein
MPNLRKIGKRKRGYRRKIPNIPKPSETLYGVERITQVRMRKDRKGCVHTEFRVRWNGDGGFSWEPMSSVSIVPLLLEELELKSKKQQLKRIGHVANNTMVCSTVGAFTQIPSAFLSKFKHPAEFIPTGTEVVRNIAEEIVDKGVELWSTTFMGLEGFYFVRRCVMEYYFPVDSALFHEMLCENDSTLKALLAS